MVEIALGSYSETLGKKPLVRERDGEIEVVVGFYQFHVPSGDEITVTTFARTINDAGLSVVFHPDGSVDGVLSNCNPNTTVRRAHADLFGALPLPGPQDKTFGVLLVAPHDGFLSTPESLGWLRDAMKGNIGYPPRVLVSPKPRDVVFTRTREQDGTMGGSLRFRPRINPAVAV